MSPQLSTFSGKYLAQILGFAKFPTKSGDTSVLCSLPLIRGVNHATFSRGKRKKKEAAMEIKVRGIEPGVVSAIDALAEKQGISRNEYLRKRITAIGILGDVEEIELKYRQFTDRIIKEVSALADAVNENTRLMADTMNRSADIEDRLSELSEKFNEVLKQISNGDV